MEIDLILIRKSVNAGEDYCVYKGIKADKSDIECVSLESYFRGKESRYVKAIERIGGMSNEKRSGDIILIMEDDSDTEVNNRFTTILEFRAGLGMGPSTEPIRMYRLLFRILEGIDTKSIRQ